MNLIEQIRKVTKQPANYSLQAKVLAVNKQKNTCTVEPLNGDSIFYDIKLQAQMSNKGLIIYPVKNSLVVITPLSETEAFVSMFSEIEDITFNKGVYGGMVKATELVKQLEKTNEVLSAILNVISGSPIPEPGNGSPSAFQIALKTAILNKQIGDYSDIENKKIKHG